LSNASTVTVLDIEPVVCPITPFDMRTFKTVSEAIARITGIVD
jgi:hypothetical protein